MGAEGMHVDTSGDDIVVRVVGDIDLINEAELERVLTGACGDRRRVVLDASLVGFVGSAALRILILTRRVCTDHGADFVIRQPSDQLVRLLEISELLGTFDIEH
jgi:anti-anti-sigma factor